MYYAPTYKNTTFVKMLILKQRYNLESTLKKVYFLCKNYIVKPVFKKKLFP